MSAKIAVMTFAYEGDKFIGFDMLESLVQSFGSTKFDLYFTDDASPSRIDLKISDWAKQRGITAKYIRYESNLGFRGASERTLALLTLIAEQPLTYDLILRIDTDALVIKQGIDQELYRCYSDRTALYGVLKNMRLKDRFGYLLDLLPFGLKRKSVLGRLEKNLTLTRIFPVWWWKEGILAIFRGFSFKYVEGSCYFMGGEFPKVLYEKGLLEKFQRHRHGLITSEEDVIITTLCYAAGLPLVETDKIDARWKLVNVLGERVVEMPNDQLPWVVHALKANEFGHALRAKIHKKMPLFLRQSKMNSLSEFHQ